MQVILVNGLLLKPPTWQHQPMEKFLITYHVSAEAMQQQMANSSPEEKAKGMEARMQWAQRVGNKMADMGAPLINGQSVGVDGSFRNSDKQVSGYSIIMADNLEEARSLVKGHPHLAGWNPEATIEVHESMPLPGM
jgi:hypothetical protein